MNVLDLFSGIGGFSLGLERAGMRTVAFCEIELFARTVLRKHWPAVPCYDDIRTIGSARLAADGITPDVLCGGFPCQDISLAGSGTGIDGERSGLWKHYARLVGEIRPHHVIVENVSALLGRGIDRVLGDLAALGYDAEWHCIPAFYAGIPQPRDRIWIVAYDPSRVEQSRRPQSYFVGFKGRVLQAGGNFNYYAPEPNVPRVGSGIPNRFHRINTLGNSVSPIFPEIIGREIMRAMAVSSQEQKTP